MVSGHITPAEQLLPFAKFVKVDVLAVDAAARKALADRLLPRGVRLVAEKVQTQAEADEARQTGYSLVQGYYFCRPTTFGAGARPGAGTSTFLFARITAPGRRLPGRESRPRRNY